MGFFVIWDLQLGGGYFYIYTLCTREREACDGMQTGLEPGGAYVAFSIWEGLCLWLRDQGTRPAGGNWRLAGHFPY